MPELGRTRPCAECPWLRKSARGYLGADNAEHFYRTSVSAESMMPCHEQIDYEDPDWIETQLPEVDLCAGNLIYYKNHMKSPRRRELSEAVRAVEPSPRVFQWAREFMEHHMPMASEGEIRTATHLAQYPPEPV